MTDPFGVFEADFGAVRTPLYNNYRSSPDLVGIQHVLARALDARAVRPTSKVEAQIQGESCAIWEFATPQSEATRLAAFVADEIRTHAFNARDFAILVRQKPASYFAHLEPAFAQVGLRLRNEAGQVGEVTLQELLAEEASAALLSVLRLLTSDRVGRHWTECKTLLAYLRGVAPTHERGLARISRELDRFNLDVARAYPKPTGDPVAVRALIQQVLEFIGRSRLVAAYPGYAQGDWLDKVLEAAAVHLQASSVTARDWASALEAYAGVQSVPLMTIHKSKGLEYHTVIFVGLDDGAWWSFAKDRTEGTGNFFVAFTRAKQRVIFTYCARRGERRQIAALYELLRLAGVTAIAADG